MSFRPNPFETVIRAYQDLEPDGTDRWNPLVRDRELAYRLCLFAQLCRALRRYPGELARLRVLDVGCGNGRSTRTYLDFGLWPEQLTGIDLRAGAIAAARRRHSGIRYLAYDGEVFPIESGSKDWVSVCTVVSSIGGPEARRHLAREISRVLAPEGFVFYFDRQRAHDFAGGDLLAPVRLFEGLTPVSGSDLDLGLEGEAARTPTHTACLFQRPS